MTARAAVDGIAVAYPHRTGIAGLTVQLALGGRAGFGQPRGSAQSALRISDRRETVRANSKAPVPST